MRDLNEAEAKHTIEVKAVKDRKVFDKTSSCFKISFETFKSHKSKE